MNRAHSPKTYSTHPECSAADIDPAAIRVLCVDDHALLIEGLRAQFALKSGCTPIAMVGSLGQADGMLDAVSRLEPHVVLLDVEMPGADSFEMADRLRHMHPQVRILVLSAHIRDGYLAAAFRSGCWGYFCKSDALEDIVAGVREVASIRRRHGAFVMGPKVREHCRLTAETGAQHPGTNLTRAAACPSVITPATTPTEGWHSILQKLSAREIEVLRLIGKGLSRVQIADALSRSAKTIDGHQDRIIRKLNVENRGALVRLAIREGLAEA